MRRYQWTAKGLVMRKSMTRRSFAKSLGLLSGGMSFPLLANAGAPHQVIAGAIRWDAWAATGGYEIPAVEKTLGPRQFHSRAPFCATFPGPDEVEFSHCASQDVVDQEIRFARGAGLSYWAYCWYGAIDPMMNSWSLHQSSQIRNLMNWCLLLQASRIGTPQSFSAQFDELIAYFKQNNYQRTADGRPLLCIFVDILPGFQSRSGETFEGFKSTLIDLATACVRAGTLPPYLVIMNGDIDLTSRIVRLIGGGAISAYAPPLAEGRPAPFALQTLVAQKFWRDMAATGSEIVPICLTGWDVRARKLHPPPWMHTQTPGLDMERYVVGGLPREITTQIKLARQFVLSNPTACRSRCLLIYSWNECDEGGSALVPGIANGQINTAILDAVAAGLSGDE